MTFAASVLPTPASPSMNSGFSSLRARKIDVARPRSPMYLRSRSRCSTSSMLVGAPAVTPKGYEADGPAGCRANTAVLTRLLDRPLGQHPGQVLFVLGARAQVTGRVQAIRCVLRRFLGVGTRVQRLLDRLGTDGRGADVGQADAPAAILLLSRGADDRPVEKAPPELDVLVRPVRHREHDLGDDLIWRERRCEQVLEEILRGDRALVGHDLRVQHQGDGRIVARRVRVRDHAADGAHVAYLVVADLARDLGQNRQILY